MNDEFLYRLRKDPPLSYALRLKAKLRQQEAAATRPVRRRPMLRTLLAMFLVGSSALAATLLAVKGPALFVEMFRPEAVEPSSGMPATPQHTPQKSVATRRAESDVPTNTFATSAPGHSASSSSNAAGSDAFSSNEATRPGSQAAAPMVAGGRDSQPHGAVQSSTSGDTVDVLATPSGYEVARSTTTWGRITAYVTPSVEMADNSAALKALCDPTGPQRADVAITSRPMIFTESDLCKQNGMRNIVEAKFGYRAVVIARAKTGAAIKLSARDLFLATARRVPAAGNSRVLIDNPNTRWDEINPALESWRIQVWGPTQELPAWNAFAELILEAGCDSYSWIAALKDADRAQYDDICHSPRQDGLYLEVRQNGLLVEQRIWSEPNAVVVLEYNFYDNNRSSLIGNLLGGVEPTRESIFNGTYPGAKPLYFIADRNPGVRFWAMQRFREFFLSDFFIGDSPHGELIPLDADARQALRAASK
jgi:phosphate transport system substrate-binding protein